MPLSIYRFIDPATDIVQLAVYGDVRREGLSCVAKSIKEMESEVGRYKRPDKAPPGCYTDTQQSK